MWLLIVDEAVFLKFFLFAKPQQIELATFFKCTCRSKLTFNDYRFELGSGGVGTVEGELGLSGAGGCYVATSSCHGLVLVCNCHHLFSSFVFRKTVENFT